MIEIKMARTKKYVKNPTLTTFNMTTLTMGDSLGLVYVHRNKFKDCSIPYS